MECAYVNSLHIGRSPHAKRIGGDLQKLSSHLPNFPWSKYPGEHHLPGHNFTDPGKIRLDLR